MLIINGNPIADLSSDDVMAQYAEDIEKAFTAFTESAGGELDEVTKQAVLDQLIAWSGENQGKTEKFPSWSMAVRSAYSKIKIGGLLGASRESKVKALNEKLYNMTMGSVRWANCGQSAHNILLGLDKLARDIREGIKEGLMAGTEKKDAEPKKRVKVSAGQGKDVVEIFKEVPKPGQILLFDCSFPDAHTFIIEVHPNGNRYLYQAYQGAYYASWWAGKDEEGLIIGEKQDSVITPEDRERLKKVREIWGCGKAIPEDKFKGMLAVLAEAFGTGKEDASAGSGGDVEAKPVESKAATQPRTFSDYWLELPFFPVKREKESIERRGFRPELEITRIYLPDPTSGAGVSIVMAVIPESIKG